MFERLWIADQKAAGYIAKNLFSVFPRIHRFSADTLCKNSDELAK